MSAGTPFHDLGDFVALPRVAGLRLAPDGTWLAAAVQTLSTDKTKYLTSIWRIDAQGGPARRLTRSAEGEGSPRFLPDGSLLFTSKRPDPAGAKQDPDSGDVAALWLLPAAGGEARVVAALPGGITAAEVARDAGTIVAGAPVLPAAGNGDSAEDDARLRQERKDAGITAILHESAPVRFWDHDLGPDQPRLFAVDPDQVQETEIGWVGGDKEPALADDPEGAERAAHPARLRDLTPEPGRALDGEAFELTPDGASVVTGWWQWDPAGESHGELVMIDVASGKRRVLLSGPEFDFSDPRVSPDGRFIACLRERHATESRLEEVTATADDGQPVRSWLVLPETAAADRQAPLLLWVHGGPMSSWNSWSWRWNPWLMAARGYAVLLPDPALSTGYGLEFIARAHREWGARPYADIMAVTEAALARPDIDADRVAMMGGSYGGYMANWMAGHTDRFKAIVSHAGLWALDQMFGTTDHPMFWRRQFGDPLTSPEMYEKNSPDRYIGRIRTPLLVIHGNKDYRVPVGEALRLWWDLSRHGAEAKFLYFPDENHWILTPGHAQIWYETVFAFLAQHVLGQQWQRPRLL